MTKAKSNLKLRGGFALVTKEEFIAIIMRSQVGDEELMRIANWTPLKLEEVREDIRKKLRAELDQPAKMPIYGVGKPRELLCTVDVKPRLWMLSADGFLRMCLKRRMRTSGRNTFPVLGGGTRFLRTLVEHQSRIDQLTAALPFQAWRKSMV